MNSIWISILNRETITLCIALALSLILLFSNDSPYVKSIESKISDGYYFLTYPQRWYKDILSIKEQNNYLAQKNIQLQLMFSENENFRSENEHLRKMLNFSDKQPLSLLPANVTNRFSNIVQSLIIDIGSIGGIKENQPIIDMNGLIGKTISIGKFASKIQLITDKNYRVSIRVGEKKSLGLFVPTHGSFGILEGVRKSMNLSVGEIAYTSGISDIYPANIPVASVIEVNDNNKRPFQDVKVKILANVKEFNYVFIVQ